MAMSPAPTRTTGAAATGGGDETGGGVVVAGVADGVDVVVVEGVCVVTDAAEGDVGVAPPHDGSHVPARMARTTGHSGRARRNTPLGHARVSPSDSDSRMGAGMVSRHQ